MVNIKLRTPYMVAQEKLKEKEIKAAKKYIKKVWGADIEMKEMSYKEVKRIGGELGMNVFNVKSFNDEYIKSQKRLKNYTRVCKYCGECYDIKIRKKSRPKGPGVCPTCKNKNYRKRNEDIKSKTKNKWEKLIIDLLKRKKCKMSILEISKELNCSGSPIRKVYKVLAREGKIIFTKANGKTGLVLLEFINGK